MYDFANKIFPLFRSLTGDGVRKTLQIISESINADLSIYEVESGTEVFDWTVPKEWVIRSAYIEDENNNHIIDISDNNLHVLGYSVAVDRWVDLDELKEYVYTEPSEPDVIPYVTSYYKERYGFCMSQNMLDGLTEGRYHMYIDSELIDGSLSYGEVIIPGSSDKEILFSTYICHPSMANNECSGPALLVGLINYLANLKDRRYTYRFAFVPETIGSITYLSQNERLKHFKEKLVAGFVLSCVGDRLHYSMIPSKYGDTVADRVLKNVLKYKDNTIFYSFRDRGSDERQYNSAGVDLPVVCFCRSKFGTFPEYHTSDDNMSFISSEGLAESLEVMAEVVEIFENNGYYVMKMPCEPQLGKRGLYSTLSRKGIYDEIFVQRDVISYADGRNDLIGISEYSNAPVKAIMPIIKRLLDNELMDYQENIYE